MREAGQINPDQLRDERTHQLQTIGFEKLGTSPLFEQKDFIIAINGENDFQFYTDYFHSQDTSAISGIGRTVGGKSVESSLSGPHLLIVYQHPNGSIRASEKVLGGSGTSNFFADKLPDRQQFDRPLEQQLEDGGFERIDEEHGVYRTVIDDEHYGKTDVYFILKDRKIKHIVRPVLKSYPKAEKGKHLVKDLGITLTGFQTRVEPPSAFNREEKRHDVITAKNSAMELEFTTDGEFKITKLLRDIESEELGVETFEPQTEPTGFTVGGTNSSELIRNLARLNGTPIATIERRMYVGDGPNRHPLTLEEMLEGRRKRTEEEVEEAKKFVHRMNTSGKFLGEGEELVDVLALNDNLLPFLHKIRIFQSCLHEVQKNKILLHYLHL